MKTVDFSETIAAPDLKVGRYRQLIGLMKICEHSRSRSFLGLYRYSLNVLYCSKNHFCSFITVPC